MPGPKKDRSHLVSYTWRCGSFTEIHPELETHTLAKPSRMLREKWLTPESIVGTKPWFESVGPAGRHGRKSLQKHSELNERHAWLTESSGAVHGNPSTQDPPVFGWQPRGKGRWISAGRGARWTPSKDWRTDGDPKAECHGMIGGRGGGPKTSPGRFRSTASSQGTQIVGSAHARRQKDMIGTAAMSQSLPNIAVHGPFPPTPAYVRNSMSTLLALEHG